ncbi:MAG TPA: hypothetical protein VFQ67_12900 [Allosphingosinicella sp.]|nr:hypothetical protein [Allosphingosinicella sp.]
MRASAPRASFRTCRRRFRRSPAPAGIGDSIGEKEAKLVTDSKTDLAAALGATSDATGMEATNARGKEEPPILPRIGTRWCLTELSVGDARVPLLRSLDKTKDDAGVRSRLLALYSDAGGMIEIMRLADEARYVVLNHGIGMVEVLGTFDAMPSLAQVQSLFGDAGEAGKVHARVRLKANGNSEIELAGTPGPQT